MNFASPYAYVGNEAEDEVDSDLLANGDQVASELKELEKSAVESPDLFVAVHPAGPPPPPPPPAAAAERKDESLFDSLKSKLWGRRKEPSEEAAALPHPQPSPLHVQQPQHQQQGAAPRKLGKMALFSDQASRQAPPPPSASASRSAGRSEIPRVGPKKVYKVKTDANVVALNFGTLALQADNIFSGDPFTCKNAPCGAVLNSHSVLKPAPKPDQKDGPVLEEGKNAPPAAGEGNLQAVGGEMLWVCEFCGTENLINIQPEEIPPANVESREYVIEPASEAENKARPPVFFVIDTSGSMCITTEVPGRVNLSGFKVAKPDIPQMEGFDLNPHKNSSVTYVSRLQCVQTAVKSQIDQWKAREPDRPVGFITFNNEVIYFGDGTSAPQVLAGDKLTNEDLIMEVARGLPALQPISQSHAGLSKQILGIEPNGATALGPALLLALEKAASGPAGASVVVCTDGKTNTGLGALVSDPNSPQRAVTEAFYEKLGERAKNSGITVSFISVTGDDCRLEEYSPVIESSGGQITLVDPLNLSSQFSHVLGEPVIATNVSIRFLVHKGFQFRGEDEGCSVVNRDVGNVTESSEETFEYEARSVDEIKQLLAKDAKQARLPFQVQINYRKLNNMRCLRVITRVQEITLDKERAQAQVRGEILASNAAKSVAKLAQRGDLEEARARNVLLSRHIAKKADHAVQANYLHVSSALESSMARQQRNSPAIVLGAPGAPNLSASPMDDRARGAAAPSSASKQRSVRDARSDVDYSVVSNAKGVSSSSYKFT